jgi:L-lactate permease
MKEIVALPIIIIIIIIMCKEDKNHIDMWLSGCLTLTIEIWKTFTTVNTAIASAALQVH